MVDPLFEIIIPTWNNPEFLEPCIRSILNNTGVLQSGLGHLTIINNGTDPLMEQYKYLDKWVTVIDAGENLGWTGGIKLGLEKTTAKFVCFQNDDTFIPKANIRFYDQLLIPFQNKNVAAVGPMTTVAAGLQSIYNPRAHVNPIEVSWMIFFTVMIKREDILSAGGIDDNLSGGDDIDLSMRLRKIGKKLIINPDAFLIHHGFKTGTRVFGDHTIEGGWNSLSMSEQTNRELIQKHGFEYFVETIMSQKVHDYVAWFSVDDGEGKLIAGEIKESEKVIELGCGPRKTVPWAIGVDKIPKGERITLLQEGESVADIVCNVTEPLPFDPESFDVVIARHILEHCIDPIKVLRQWALVLKPEGRMYIAVPDEQITTGIPLSPDHCHAFNAQSLESVAKAAGLALQMIGDPKNGVSLVACFRKEKEPAFSESLGVSLA